MHRWLATGWRPYVLIFLLAFTVRVGFVARDGVRLDQATLRDDSPDFYAIAVSIQSGRGVSKLWPGSGPDAGQVVPTALRAPLWPATQAVAYRAFKPSPTLGRVLNIGIDSLTCALIALLGTRLRNRRTGLIAGAVAAVYAPMFIHTEQLLSEPLTLLLVVATLLAAEAYLRGPTWARAALFGAGVGLATLTRANAVLIGVFVAVWLLWRGRHRLLPVVRHVAVAGAAALAVVAPYSAYASARMGTFVPVTTQTGILLAGDFNDTVADTGTPHWGWWDFDLIIAEFFEVDSEIEWDRNLRHQAFEWIGDNPGTTIKIIGLRTVRYWDLYWGIDTRLHNRLNSTSRPFTVLSVLSWWMVAPLGIAGAVMLKRRGELERWMPALLLLAAFAASGMLLGGATRYRVPADPVVLLLAAAFVAEMWGARRRGDRAVASATTASEADEVAA